MMSDLAIVLSTIAISMVAVQAYLLMRSEKTGDLGLLLRRLAILEENQDILRGHLMNVLRPIRQNAESIDQVDDDLLRLERRVEVLAKKAGEDFSPACATCEHRH